MKSNTAKLGDFTTTPRVIFISGLDIVIGLISSYVALALLRLIGLFTNLCFYGRFSTTLVSPAGNHLGTISPRAAMTACPARNFAPLQ